MDVMLGDGASVVAVTSAVAVTLAVAVTSAGPLVSLAAVLLLCPGHHVVVPMMVLVVTTPTGQLVTEGGHEVTVYILVEVKVEVNVGKAVVLRQLLGRSDAELDLTEDLTATVWFLREVETGP